MTRGGAVRALWLTEALAREEDDATAPALRGDLTADVCIVGGGYTGLWAALHIKRADPAVEVAVLERDICGAGASGRNSGALMDWWSRHPTLAPRIGDEAAERICSASERAVEAVHAFCADEGIDAEIRRDGLVFAAAAPARLGNWDTMVAGARGRRPRPYEALDASAAASASGTDRVLGGVLDPAAATVQPALLARGLRRVALERGVRIFEGSPARRLEPGSPARAVTVDGSVRAPVVIVAAGAWSGALVPALQRRMLVIGADAIASEPIPEQLGSAGWPGGRGIVDGRRMINGWRTDPRGRLYLIKSGGSFSPGRWSPAAYDGPARRTGQILEQFEQVFPTLRAHIRPAATWRGPIDYTLSALPWVGPVPGAEGVLVGVGYCGTGVGQTHMCGEMLAGQALGRVIGFHDELLARPPEHRLPPEPLRSAGGRLVRRAIARREAAEDRGGRPGLLTRAVADRDPTGYVRGGAR